MVRDELGQTPPVVQQFLLDLLAYNDNLTNLVSLRFNAFFFFLTSVGMIVFRHFLSHESFRRYLTFSGSRCTSLYSGSVRNGYAKRWIAWT